MKLGIGPALLLAVGASAHAQNSQRQLTGPLCETQEQVNQYIALYNGDQQPASRVDNAEEHDSLPSEIASVAFVRGPQVGTGQGHDMGFQIVRILVVGVSTPSGIRPVKPAPYFTVLGIRELAI
jgi:hypothetical protein